MQRNVIRELENIVGTSGVLSSPEDLLLYEYDGSVEEAHPDAIVFPRAQARRSRNRRAGESL